MAHRALTASLLVALALGCGSDRTAIVLEATNETKAALELVVFHVRGPGLDGGAREASASLTGPQARSFPLTLVLVDSSDSMAGPYDVTIEGRHLGQAVAAAVRTDDKGPIGFSPGEVVHYHFALRPLASTDSTPPPIPTPPSMMPPPMMPPPVDAGSCAITDTCTGDHKCACPTGCACQFTCGADHCTVACEGAGTTCQVDVQGAEMANVDCAGGAACLVSGSPQKKDVHFGCAGGKPLDCGNEVQVCNRNCP